MKKAGEKALRILMRAGLYALAAGICLPVLLVAAGSIKSSLELSNTLSPIVKDTGEWMHYRLFPDYPTLRNYITLLFLTPQFFVVFWNSVRIVVCILAGQFVVALPAAWTFARYSSRSRRLLYRFYILLMLLPFQVMMLPSYLYLNRLGLMDTLWAVILPAVFSTFPVFLMVQGFEELPEEMLEAARIDGAGEWQLFVHIGIPLGSNGIFCAMTLGFLDYWNMIEQPLAFLKNKSLWPLSLYLPQIDLTQAGMVLAASVVTLIPAVFVFILGQEYLEMGIVSSGMKE